jgi:His-Xaa-Ser system protein HxsD
MPTVKLPREIATSDSIQRALYRIAASSSWDLSIDGDQWVVELHPVGDVDPDQLVKAFKEHVIDYALREKVRAETEQVRALLLAHAFSGVTSQA